MSKPTFLPTKKADMSPLKDLKADMRPPARLKLDSRRYYETHRVTIKGLQDAGSQPSRLSLILR